jgi:hypothetical protein
MAGKFGMPPGGMPGATMPSSMGGKRMGAAGGMGAAGEGRGGTPYPGRTGGYPRDTTPTDAKLIPHERTEFVILFIWREPTPSDALRGIEGGDSGTPTTPATPMTTGEKK